MSQMIKFFGEPLKEIMSKHSGKVMFRFDSKGAFITDDPEIIRRAMGFFDYVPVAPGEVGERVKKTYIEPPITITTKDQEEKQEGAITGDDAQVPGFSCPYCDFKAANKSGLTAHIRAKHKE